ncbi:plastid lipid-associated PAP/fibrillin family protein [Nitzschia inconspicua]|uniref:Plastid lipid-associated PAP/fibrillin family protein n=1 Tax=Nitzschia inconspicua TaxID=303405 RepID=A0A9K3KQD0_9STRA|nr:plastid lipid-associated PAP/fibrillin family protein [Nitzschia inconspicua]
MLQLFPIILLLMSGLCVSGLAWSSTRISSRPSCSDSRHTCRQLTISSVATTALKASTMASTWFAEEESFTSAPTSSPSLSVEQLKAQLLQLGAALDRGQAYNPTSGEYYSETMSTARSKIQQLLDTAESSLPKSLTDIDGEWELILSTVHHGIFRSSPFFLAIQESYEYAEQKTFGESGINKSDLFFKLHELQTCSWGVSKVGRIAQHIDASKQYLYSTFDTSLFSLTVIPILGWFKLLPTFGGCVVTAATCQEISSDTFQGRNVARLDMTVDYTTSRKVPGLNGLPLLGDFIWKIKVPVGAIWKLLPWNKGRDATCKVYINYLDNDFRIVQDIDGEFFVYTRPVVPRPLEGFD